MITQDEIPGGMELENYGPHVIKVYSHTERRAVMAERGLTLKEKFCPMPGTDIDPAGIPNPKGYVDPQTLANGAELICRNGKSAPEFDGVEAGVLKDFFNLEATTRDAEAVAGGDPRRSSRAFRRMQHE